MDYLITPMETMTLRVPRSCMVRITTLDEQDVDVQTEIEHHTVAELLDKVERLTRVNRELRNELEEGPAMNIPMFPPPPTPYVQWRRKGEVEWRSYNPYELDWDNAGEIVEMRLLPRPEPVDLADAILYLFQEAEHDAQRMTMLMSLRERMGHGHNMGRWEADMEVDWDTAVREALERPSS